MEGFVPWPDDIARLYRERGYWRGTTIGEAFAASVAQHAERIAIIDGERRITYRELGALVDRLAGHLLARDLGRSSVILFQLPNTLELIAAYFAAVTVGAIPICALPHHRHTEVGGLARLAEAHAWFGPASHGGFDYLAMLDDLAPSLPSLREVWTLRTAPSGSRATASIEALLAADAAPLDSAARRPMSADVAVLQLSGGTTGVPKLIPRTHDDYLYNSLAFAERTSLGADDALLVAIPIAHNFPLACPGIQGALLLGARVVVASSPAPDVVFPLIARERVTWIPAVPATLIRWTDEVRKASVHDLSSIRRIYVGGQRLHPEPARAAIETFGPVVRQVYGMAEGLLCCTADDDPADAHVLTQGRAMSAGDEIRVVDDDGSPVAPGEIGEMTVRGPYTIRGYYRAAQHNENAFTPDGYYRTGDMVRVDADGYVIVEGRRKDLIKRGGEKISAEDIEDLLLGHPAIGQIAVVGVPDRVLGERACACIVLSEGTATLTLEDIARFMSAKNVSKLKIPERLELFEKLPLTGVGKVSKKDLRAIVAERATSPVRSVS